MEHPAVKTIDLLLELVELEAALDAEAEAARTIPLVEVADADIAQETIVLSDAEIQAAVSDTRRTPSLFENENVIIFDGLEISQDSILTELLNEE